MKRRAETSTTRTQASPKQKAKAAPASSGRETRSTTVGIKPSQVRKNQENDARNLGVPGGERGGQSRKTNVDDIGGGQHHGGGSKMAAVGDVGGSRAIEEGQVTTASGVNKRKSLKSQSTIAAGTTANNDTSMIDETTAILLEINNMSEKEVGDTYRDVVVEEQVKQFCKNTLFHKLKFIVKKEDLSRLEKPHDIGNYVMKGLHVVDDSSKARWWILYQGVVKKALDTQRSNANMAIKRVMIGKQCICILPCR